MLAGMKRVAAFAGLVFVVIVALALCACCMASYCAAAGEREADGPFVSWPGKEVQEGVFDTLVLQFESVEEEVDGGGLPEMRRVEPVPIPSFSPDLQWPVGGDWMYL